MDTATFWSAFSGTGIAAALFAFWMTNYFGPYLKAKATNLATHEDIRLLINQVQETERVKAQISDSVWDRQQRWAFKRDLYRELIAAVVEIYQAEIYALQGEKLNSPAPERIDLINDILKCIRNFHLVATFAAVVIEADAYKVVREIEQKGKLEGQAKLDFYEDALEKLKIAARKDLGYGEV